MKTKPLTFAFFLFLWGCSTRTIDFYYISLEQHPDAKIERFGRLNNPGSEEKREVPLMYSLERADYSILIGVATDTYQSAADITLGGNREEGLTLKPIRGAMLKTEDGIYCQSYSGLEGKTGFRFVWARSCLGERYSRQIQFDVLSTDGELVGREHIEFELQRHGTFSFSDQL